MSRLNVGVLRGGTSSEYDLSLKTGAAMIGALPEDKYQIRDILIDKQGIWHLRGMPVAPARALSQLDVVLSALHGGIGEDGTVIRVLERASVPYAGSRPLPSGMALNKMRSREILQRAGIRMPRALHCIVGTDRSTAEMAKEAFAQFPPPYIVKPQADGASHGIRYAPHIIDLPHTIGDVLDAFGAAIVEEFIRGREATVGIIQNFRHEPLYAFPPARVLRPQGARMLDRAHHEEGTVQYLVPSDFTMDEKKRLMDMARTAHQALDLEHFSRADFIVTPRHVYLLEVNTIPGLYEGSAFPPMLESVGSSIKEFVEHAIHLARHS